MNRKIISAAGFFIMMFSLLVLTGCTNASVNDDSPGTSAVSKTELTVSIAAATVHKNSKTAGTGDGNVAQAAIDIYASAIAAAQKVADNAGATQGQVNAAVETLASATAAFGEAVIVVRAYLQADGVNVNATIGDWGTGTVQNLSYLADAAYSPCIELKGGASWGAVISFEGLTKGLLSKYATLEFKIRTSGASSVKVKVPEVEKTYTLAAGTALSGGWKKMSIPLSDFSAVTAGTASFAIFGSPALYLTDIQLKGLALYAVSVTVTEGSSPIQGATVSSDGKNAVTNASGVAVLTLSNGTFEITAVKAGYIIGSGTVTVNGGAASSSVSLVSSASVPYILSVNVKEGSGQFASPLSGASVTINGITKKTGSDGIALMNVASGSIPVTIEKDGYADLTVAAAVSGANATVNATLSLGRKPSVSADTWTAGTGWTLAWADEFSVPALDGAKWVFQEAVSGKFNSELQEYTSQSENCFITNRDDSGSDGTMVIQALKTGLAGGMGDFTSARMITHGKKDFKYGKVAARIQVPYGQGIWPAFWMLGSNINENPGGTVAWPKCGEIDIMEKKGGSAAEERLEMGTFHYWNDRSSAENKWEYATGTKTMSADLSDDFHVYEVEWNASAMIWRIDGSVYHSVDTTDPAYGEFRENFYILLNLAVGGTFDGSPDASTVFPQYMFVDWVRIYQ